MNEPIDDPLTPDELELLRCVARDETTDVPLVLAARLEQRQLIVSGWGKTHLVTERGIEYLEAHSSD